MCDAVERGIRLSRHAERGKTLTVSPTTKNWLFGESSAFSFDTGFCVLLNEGHANRIIDRMLDTQNGLDLWAILPRLRVGNAALEKLERELDISP